MARAVRFAVAIALLSTSLGHADDFLKRYEAARQEGIAADLQRTRQEGKRTLRRAGGWLALGALSFVGNVYYTRKADKAEGDAQAYRDQIASEAEWQYIYDAKHGRWDYLYDPNGQDFGPARNMEKRADKYRNRANVFFAGAAICGVVGALNVNQYLKIRTDAKSLSLSLEKRFK